MPSDISAKACAWWLSLRLGVTTAADSIVSEAAGKVQIAVRNRPCGCSWLTLERFSVAAQSTIQTG